MNPNAEEDFDADALTAAFNKMARREGFEPSTASFAESDTFEDEFELGDDDVDDFDGDDDGDYLDFGEDPSATGGGAREDSGGRRASLASSMADRISAAKKDMDLGRVTASDQLDTFSKKASQKELRKLGFRRESNPFGDNDERSSWSRTPPRAAHDTRPGFLPPDKYNVQIKLGKIEVRRDILSRYISPIIEHLQW